MRKLVWIALLALAALCFFLLIIGAGKNTEDAEAAAPAAANRSASFGAYSSEIADFGNESAALMHLFLYPNAEGNVTLLCSSKPLQKDIILLSYPFAPGVNGSLSEKIKKGLAMCGISAREANASAALAAKDAVIIAASGAVPSVLANGMEAIEKNNARVIVVSLLSGREIDGKGAIFQMNKSTGFEIIEMAPGGEGSAAAEAVEAAIYPKHEWKADAEGWEGEMALALPLNGSEVHCRAIYAERGELRFTDSGKLVKPEGTLRAQKSALAGQEVAFEFSVANGTDAGRNLRFRAIDFLGRKKIGEKEIAGGEIKDGWASAFSMGLGEAGAHVVRVEDQFGRLHAAAYVEALGLEITPVSQEGGRYEFKAEFGRQPIDGMVEVRLDDGEKKKFYSSLGKLVVRAAPSAGKRVMFFEYGGLKSSWEFVSEGGGLADTYLKLGLPALAFLVAAYLVLRAGRKVKYSIVFPEFAEPESEMVEIGCDEIIQAYSEADRKNGGHCLAVYPEEIAAHLAGKIRLRINALSLKRVLGQLVSRGEFCEWNGTYAPVEKMRGFSAWQLAAMRVLHDVMLERGMAFGKKDIIRANWAGIEFVFFSGTPSVLRKIGKMRRAVLFESREELEGFEQTLSGHGRENVRIKLALENGHLLFLPAKRSEIEAVL